MTRRANRPALCVKPLVVEQLEDRLTPAGSVVPAGEFNWTQYSPSGELGQLVWNGDTLVYRSRVAGSWHETEVASAGGFTASQYHTRDAVQKASQTAQLVFTTDGTPHALFLEKQWNSSVNRHQTLIQHYARTTTGWQWIETITPNWTSQWGPNNLVAAAGPNNSIHLIFTETNALATGVGNFGTGFLHYATNASGRWQFNRIAETADLSQDVWFMGGRWAPRFLSLAVDAQGFAHVTYTPQFYIAGAFSTVQSTLMYATNRGGRWSSQVVMAPQDGTADAGLGASIAISPTGQVAIASYYVDRFNTGSPQSSQLLYHTLVQGSWQRSVVTSTPDRYVAGDGPRFTGFAPQLFFDAAGRANIVFSDEAAEHLPVSFANQFAGQIRLATLHGSTWSLQTIYRQNDPVRNQLFYPVAASYRGQITFAGLEAVSSVDANRNPTRTDFGLVNVNTPYGLSAPPRVTASTPPTPATTQPLPSSPPVAAPPIAGSQRTTSPTGWAVANDAGVLPSTVSVYRPDGSLALRVVPFGDGYRGGVRIARVDINRDGVPDLITATGPGIAARIRIWDGVSAALMADWEPFPGYQGGLWVDAGDMDGDGIPDIAVGTDGGLSPHVKVFSGRHLGELASFYAYLPGFIGGVRVAMGDINRDGFADLVTAPGFGAGPHIAIFDGRALSLGWGPQRLANDFYIFDPSMRSGLNIAVGDIDGDGYADLIAAPQSGPAHLRVVSGYGLAAGAGDISIASMYTWGAPTGLRVAAVDADGDGRTDIIATTTTPNNGLVARFAPPALLANDPSVVQWFHPWPGLTTSVYVG
ncbi:MAG: VCBS repeat-containing protein [Gemmataceae bacterium]|nr:VCBS repeat-containing protein [Gemmata sp.]MDW8196388.1 VCBS repeat-containing protein [Gemmataceae bacterium]